MAFTQSQKYCFFKECALFQGESRQKPSPSGDFKNGIIDMR
jgi:hypothetical protein